MLLRKYNKAVKIMGKTIKFNLSESSIDNAILELRRYKEDINKKIDIFVQRLAQVGVTVAQAKVSEHSAVYTGELLNSISLEPGAAITNGSKWIIYTGCEWAPYVEFGTGIVGSESPHPSTSIANWKYDVNGHGDKGWHYYKDGEWHWTKGMPSRPFMFETSQELRTKVVSIAKEVFANG